MPVDHPTETFRDIQGWIGYRISNLGRVQSCRIQGSRAKLSDTWHDLKWLINIHGYAQIALQNGGKRSQPFVHRLVLGAFVGPCPPGMECRHLDGDRLNNRLDNLAWGSRKANWQDRKDHGRINPRRGEEHGAARLNEADVLRILELKRRGFGITRIVREMDLPQSTVGNILYGRRWKHLTCPQGQE